MVSLGALGLLSAASAPAGLICIVDDAHWLDRASLGAIVFAARRLEADGVVVLLAARERDASEPVARRPAGAARRRPGCSAATSLIPGSVHPEVRRRLVEMTSSNTLALLELPGVLSADQLAGGGSHSL
jgi:hypothetical protein